MPTPKNTAEGGLLGPEEFLKAVREPGKNLRRRYETDPLALATRFHLKLPKKPLQVMQDRGLYNPEVHGPIEPGLRDLVLETCTGAVRSAAAVGPRGGGKSMGVSFVEFYLVFVKLYDALNLGGSELQADQVYQYLLQYIESDPYWAEMLKGEPLQSKTETLEGAWIRVLTASQKSVRSPHAGGRKKDGRLAGGLLVIDEEAEAAPDIVEAALPTINTARPSVNIRCSTFHNAEGTFADLIDNHAEMGYKLYRWDIFDVCEGCDCVNECQSPEPCFREDHFETYVDPDTGEQKQRMIHKAYCGGRARFADGWIPMEEIETLWKRMKRNHSRWEVEAMGMRPTRSGYVIKSHDKLTANIVDVEPATLYEPGSPVHICVDWGTVAAGITVWQEQYGDKHALLYAEELHEAGQAEIFGKILGLWTQYQDATEVAADIGGGGNYLNETLREEHRIPVRGVNFQQEKEGGVAAMNMLNESGSLIIPAEHQDFIRQMRNWRRKNQHIQKGDDHLCDSAVCYFSRFIERFNLRKIAVVPRSFSSAPPPPSDTNREVERPRTVPSRGIRAGVVRSIGRRS